MTKIWSILFKYRQYSTTSNMSKRALIFLAPGAEEMEFVIAADVLVRGGIEVKIVGLPDTNLIRCSRGISIKPDMSLAEAAACGCGTFDAVVLPGGLGGSEILAKSHLVGQILQAQEQKQRIIAAICAAPLALKAHGIALGKMITSYPGVRNQLECGYNYQEEHVVVDGNIITSRGPGTAFLFALTIVEKLMGTQKAKEVANAMLVCY